MSDSCQPYINACPIGCAPPLQVTDIVLPQGPLRRCPDCGQLVSQASAALYRQTMTRFDQADFNHPAGHALDRRHEVARRRLRKISGLLGKAASAAIRLVDVGCSRGQFVAAAAQLGFDAEGVEPAPRIAAAARAARTQGASGIAGRPALSRCCVRRADAV